MTRSRIYTKTGDDGTTGLLYGGRVSKGDELVDAYGDIDEAVAALGAARAAGLEPRLQRELFAVAADLAASPRQRNRLVPGISLVTAEMTADVEQLIELGHRFADGRLRRAVEHQPERAIVAVLDHQHDGPEEVGVDQPWARDQQLAARRVHVSRA